MIKVLKEDIPLVLQQNQHAWTVYFKHALEEYGDYKSIPKEIKGVIEKRYRHSDIQKAIIDSTNGKCVFCESFIESVDYTNIEHFFPKSIHYKHTYKWSNLFPACRRCNIPKTNLDTRTTPLVHPTNDNGELFFKYSDLKIEIKDNAPCSIKARNTIKHCNLSRISLIRSHSAIILSFYEVEEKLKETLEHYQTLVQSAAQLRIALSVLEAIDNLKAQSNAKEPYAGFLRHIISKSEILENSILLINSKIPDLGLSQNYDFEW